MRTSEHNGQANQYAGENVHRRPHQCRQHIGHIEWLEDILIMPPSKGTKARTTAVKRARNTLVTPYLRINCALRSISQGSDRAASL